jgi:hypothetical protein
MVLSTTSRYRPFAVIVCLAAATFGTMWLLG